MGGGSSYYSLESRVNCVDDVCPERLCTRCPRGAECAGEHRFRSKCAPKVSLPCPHPSRPLTSGAVHVDVRILGAQWAEASFVGVSGQRSRVFRIRACPPGTILVRSESDPSADECASCPSESYSLEWPSPPLGLEAGPVVGTATNAVDGVSRWCLPCPTGSTCSNAGGRSSITARTGFWRQPGCMHCAQHACDEDGCDPRQCSPCSELAAHTLDPLAAWNLSTTPNIDVDPHDAAPGLAPADSTRRRAISLSCPPGVCEDGGCARFNHGPVCGRSAPHHDLLLAHPTLASCASQFLPKGLVCGLGLSLLCACSALLRPALFVFLSVRLCVCSSVRLFVCVSV